MKYLEAFKQVDFIRDFKDHPIRFIADKGLLEEFVEYLLRIVRDDVNAALDVVLYGRDSHDGDY